MTSSGYICIGFAYKSKSMGEDQLPQDRIVWDSRTNQEPWARSTLLKMHLVLNSRTNEILWVRSALLKIHVYCIHVHSGTQLYAILHNSTQ